MRRQNEGSTPSLSVIVFVVLSAHKKKNRKNYDIDETRRPINIIFSFKTHGHFFLSQLLILPFLGVGVTCFIFNLPPMLVSTQRTTCRNLFSPSIMWIWGIEHRSSGLPVSTFILRHYLAGPQTLHFL